VISPSVNVITKKYGQNPIFALESGMEVLTHKGSWKKITKVIKTPYIGDIKRISVSGDYETINITEDNPILAITKTTLSSKDKNRSVKHILGDKQKIIADFIPVNQLKNKDLFLVPIDDTVVDREQIDLWDSKVENCELVEDVIVQNIPRLNGEFHQKFYTRYLNVDENFCKFYGMFIMNGQFVNSSIPNKPPYMAMNTRNDNARQLFTKVIGELTFNEHSETRRGKLNYRHVLHAPLVCEFFKSEFRKIAQYDKIPEWILQLPIQKQWWILQGMFINRKIKKAKNGQIQTCFSTQYYSCIQGIKTILNRLRIPYTSYVNDKFNEPLYRFVIYGDIMNFQAKDNGCMGGYYNNYKLFPVKSIENVEFEYEYVYSLEVEDDNSCVTPIGTVYNG
jgi:hypothetical protein